MVHSFYSSAQPSGENIVVSNEVDALRRGGHDVRLFALRTDDLEARPFYRTRTALRLATGRGPHPGREIVSFEPDVVHIHNLFPNFGSRWVVDLRSPLVVTLHNYRRICANGMLYRNGAICTRCVDGSSLNALRYACYRGSRLATLPVVLDRDRLDRANVSLSRAAQVIVYSDHLRGVLARFLDDGDERVRVVPQFVPDAQLGEMQAGSQETDRVDADRHGWLFAGRLTGEKGLLELLDRWPVDVELTVAGDGELLDEAKRVAASKPVSFAGRVEPHELVPMMRRARGFVFPSVRHAMFGRVHAESLAAGLPILAFRPTEAAREVEELDVGLAADWAAPLDAVLADATERFPALHDRCRAVFAERHSESAFVARAAAIYRTAA